MKKYNLIGTTATIDGQGCKKKTPKSFGRNLTLEVKKHHFISAQKLAEQAEEDYGIIIPSDNQKSYLSPGISRMTCA